MKKIAENLKKYKKCQGNLKKSAKTHRFRRKSLLSNNIFLNTKKINDK